MRRRYTTPTGAVRARTDADGTVGHSHPLAIGFFSECCTLRTQPGRARLLPSRFFGVFDLESGSAGASPSRNRRRNNRLRREVGRWVPFRYRQA